MGLVHLGSVVLLGQARVVSRLSIKENDDEHGQDEVDEEQNKLEFIYDITEALSFVRVNGNGTLLKAWVLSLPNERVLADPNVADPHGCVLSENAEYQYGSCCN